MPVRADRPSTRALPGADAPAAVSPVESREPDVNRIDVALVNNMPDAALKATERQFVTLLGAAAGNLEVRLSFYALPEVPRTEWGRGYVDGTYAPIDGLWSSRLDGLIVTGTEPQAPNLEDEPYWGSLTRLVDWAEQNTYSAVWSCLAAHAAVLYLDGVERRPLGDKRFGVFDCARVADHPLTAGAPAHVPMPHSRWNELPADDLTQRGCRVLTCSDEAGVDMFVKQRNSLFVFFQGHPEYDATTLLLEYRRDIGRFLRGERETYPPMPHGYFDAATTEALTALRERALVDRREELLNEFPVALAAEAVTNTWRPAAERLYHNWLAYLHTQKTERRHAER
jgi:homoserine O-succinyltransferase/O-acetyltransferase